MPDLISSVHMRNIAFSRVKDQVGKEQKSFSKETKNGMIPYIFISAVVYSILICLKLFVDTEKN